jgi:pimeloyl-ACP methyl ester carboxylesterase
VTLSNVKLWAWDSGGSGEPIVLLHPLTGSDASWGYQYAAFTRAGYRVIAYSRRGFGRSERRPGADPGYAVDDLSGVADALGLHRFHLVGSAAGGFISPDYALSHPDRLLTVVIANSLAGITDPDYQAVTRRLTPDGFVQLPPDFRELGPSYRASNPAGVARWLQLEHASLSGPLIVQQSRNQLRFGAFASIRAPILLLTGEADPFMPPTRLRALADRLSRANVAIMPAAGHSVYWEQPEAFNGAVLAFLLARGQGG